MWWFDENWKLTFVHAKFGEVSRLDSKMSG